MRILLAITVALAVTGCMMNPSAPTATPPITLQTTTGKFEVPTSGPLSDLMMTGAATELEKARGKIDEISAPSTEVELTIRNMARELYNEATNNIDLTIRIAKRTSSTLDQNRIDEALKSAETLRSLLETPPPPSLYVATQIDIDNEDGTIHYMSMRDYMTGLDQWESYTYKQKMHIGRYSFRVLPCKGSDNGYIEQLLILAEPTQKRIQTTCGQ